MGVYERDKENGPKLENIHHDVMQENFPNLARQAKIQIQKIQRTPVKYFIRKSTPKHKIIRFSKVKMKKRMLGAAGDKARSPTKRSPSD